MNAVLWKKIKEAASSVLPIALFVFACNLTPLVNFTGYEMLSFFFSVVMLIVGIGLFNLGADWAMTPMGEHMGASLTKSRKFLLLIGVAFFMGLCITIAEPDLTVLSEQLENAINPILLVGAVGVGVGLFLVLAVFKMLFRKHLASLLMFFYLGLFALTAILLMNNNGALLAAAFDSGGVTTGPITVPFLMAFGVGIAGTLGGKDKGENSFGIVALCSVGPILAVLLLGVFSTGEMHYEMVEYTMGGNIFLTFFASALSVMKEVALAIALIAVFFIVLQYAYLKLPKAKLKQIGVGIVYTYVGLVLFLTAAKVAFLPMGFKMGTQIAETAPFAVVAVGFILGLVTVMAEPAVHVLNKQVEEITDGMVSRRSMMVALSLGVGISVALAGLRIVLDFSLLYYIVPGYLLSLGLSFFVPGLYTAIAFDSGGVASGPLTSSFILPFAIGACAALQGEAKILSDAFGVVAMVAMTPLITIQLLGFRAIVAKRVRERIAWSRILGADDEQIMDFDV